MWQEVRNRNFQGLKFVRQHPILYRLFGNKDRYFIADFYCHQHRLIIEVDGKIHLSQVEYDIDRTKILEGMGYTVIRFTNGQVNYSIEIVLAELGKTIGRIN